MKTLAHGTYTMITGVVYLALITNLLLVLACLPLVLLLITTDPARSWPLLAVAAPLCAPGVSAAFATFLDQHVSGPDEGPGPAEDDAPDRSGSPHQRERSPPLPGSQPGRGCGSSGPARG